MVHWSLESFFLESTLIVQIRMLLVVELSVTNIDISECFRENN